MSNQDTDGHMNRREFLKRLAAGGATLALAGAGVGIPENVLSAPASREPVEEIEMQFDNILLLFSDQHRADTLGCYGNDIVQTPNIDRLAASGVRFDNCYSPCPVCGPARTCIESGQLAHRHDIRYNDAQASRRGLGGRTDPAEDLRFFTEALGEQGYECAHVGKWHIGETALPEDYGNEGVYYPGYGYPKGHEHYEAYLQDLGLDGFNLLEDVRTPETQVRSYHGLQEGPEEAAIPHYLAHQTIEFIEKFTANDNPFYISCNFWGPHGPHWITEPHYSMYDDVGIPAWENFDCDLSDKPGVIQRYGEYWATQWFNEKNMSTLIGKYYGYMTLIDAAIGRILQALEAAGELDNTLILYAADHGSSVGSYRMWDKGFGMYDCITRIPLIASHPTLQPRGSEAFVTLLDFAPTFLQIGGAQMDQHADGESLIPIVSGEKDAVREDFIVTEHFGHQLPFWQRMVRTPEAKYIHNPTSRDEYYDLVEDPAETNNILEEVSSTELDRMQDRLMAWMEETGDPLQFWTERCVAAD